MTQTRQRPSVKDTIEKLGRCIELISMDPRHQDISVGLFLKGRVLTVWSYSTVKGVEGRLGQIRDRVVLLGDLTAVEDSATQATLPPGDIPAQALKFLFKEAVMKDPAGPAPSGPMSARDNKSTLTFTVTGAGSEEGYTYTVTAAGVAQRPEARVRAVVGGFMRYGECVRLRPDAFRFADGMRHDGFVRLLLPYARNVSAVDNLIAADDMAGQMTIQTLGFAQS